jgi:hypothetical protein
MNAVWHTRHPVPKGATPRRRLAWHSEHQKHCGCRPIPPGLATLAEPIPRPRAKASAVALRALISGGDRRSLARSSTVLALVRAHPQRVAEIAALAGDDDWLVSMRALDLLEKIAREHAEWVQPHRRLLIGRLADSDEWERRLQIVRALPLLEWTPAERRRAVEILRRDIGHPQKFVRAWALEGLAVFARHDAGLMPIVRRCLRDFERSGSGALAARARHVREHLSLR